MSFGKNLQFLRHLRGNMTQEDLAEKMNISRQTVSKWELDTAQPEMDKAIELCRLFNCTLDNLFRDDMVVCGEDYTNLRVETVPAFRYIKHAVISSEPEGDAIDRIYTIARKCGVEHPRVIGWDFPKVSCMGTRRHGYCLTESSRLTFRYSSRLTTNMRQYT